MALCCALLPLAGDAVGGVIAGAGTVASQGSGSSLPSSTRSRTGATPAIGADRSRHRSRPATRSDRRILEHRCRTRRRSVDSRSARGGIDSGMEGGTSVARVLAFDVNETLLDLSSLDPRSLSYSGIPVCVASGFPRCSSWPSSARSPNRYVDFTSAQHAALAMLAEREGVVLSDADGRRIVGAHARARAASGRRTGALSRLRQAGFTLAALTNSPLDVSRDQLRHAALDRALRRDPVR